MKKVLIVNGVDPRCGVYQYGRTTVLCLAGSKKYEFSLGAWNVPESFEVVAKHYDAIIYNYHPHIMPWVTTEFIKKIKTPQFGIGGHDSSPPEGLRAIFVADPTFVQKGNLFPVGRPVLNVDLPEYADRGIVRVGTFGFGFFSKKFDEVVAHVRNSFAAAEINVHIPIHPHGDPQGVQASHLKSRCEAYASENIKVNVTHDFMTTQQLVEWLHDNTINIFIYPDEDNRGVSSTIDYALAAKRPLAINHSKMFRHIWHEPRILLETNPILQIVNAGIEPIQQFLDKWNPASLQRDYENVLDKFI